MPAIYIDKHSTTGFQISACVNGNKDVFYKTREDNKFADKEPGANFLSQTIMIWPMIKGPCCHYMTDILGMKN